MNTLIEAPWTKLLGSSIHDPLVMEFIAQLHPQLLRATVTGLGLGDTPPKEAGFEKILDQGENTNFDFFMDFGKAGFATFEVKFTESGFASADFDKEHRDKL